MTDTKALLDNNNQETTSSVASADYTNTNSNELAKQLGLLFGLAQTKIEIKFPENFDILKAVEILNLIDAVACAPETIPYSKNKQNTNNNYSFVADTIHTQLIINSVPELGIGNLTGFRYNIDLSNDFEKQLSKSNKAGMEIHENGKNNVDRINFLQFLLSCETHVKNPSPEFATSARIFKQFMLSRLMQIKSEQNEAKQTEMLVDCMRHIILTERDWANKNNMFADLGVVKYANGILCIKVFTDNGTYTELHDLDTTKTHKIIHSMDVSKLKPAYNFSDFSNMEFNGDFICRHQKKTEIKFPAKINGLFDCFGYGFNIPRIPYGAKTVDLSHTCIKSFTDLNNIQTPQTVQDLILDNSVMKNILKLKQTPRERLNNADIAELEAYNTFVTAYPNIIIRDSSNKFILNTEIQNIHSKEKLPTQILDEVKTQTPVIIEKTSGWLTPEEVKQRLMQMHPGLQSIADLDRRIQSARNLNSDVRKEIMKHNGQDCLCICEQDIEKLVNNIQSVLDKENRRVAKAQNVKPVVNTSEPVKNKVVAPKTKKQKFKHYIHTSVFKQIKAACGDSATLLVSVMERFCQINYDYTPLSNDNPLVQLDKHGNHLIIQNTSHKRGKAAAMGIENNDNRRIVLTINPQDKIVVATAFFLDHVNNRRQYLAYNNVALSTAAKGYLMDGATFVTRDLVKSDEYIDIDKWLKNYLKDKEAEQPVVVTKEVTTVTTKTVTTTVVMSQNDNVALTGQSATTKRRRRISATLVDVDAMSAKVQAFIDMLNKDIQDLSQELCNNQDNPHKQLQTVKLLEKLVMDKMKMTTK